MKFNFIYKNYNNVINNSIYYGYIILSILIISIIASFQYYINFSNPIIFSSNIFLIIVLAFLLLLSKKSHLYPNIYIQYFFKNSFYFFPLILLYFSAINGFNAYLNMAFSFSVLLLGLFEEKNKNFIIYSTILICSLGLLLYFSDLNSFLKKLIFFRIVSFNIIVFIIINFKHHFIKKIKFNEDLFNAVFNKFSEAIIVISKDTQKILIANESAYELFKISNSNTITEHNIFDLLNNTSEEQKNSIINSNNWNGELLVDINDNKKIWLQVNVSKVRDNENQRIFKFVDISSTKNAASLYEKISITENLNSNIIVISNINFIIEYVNDKFLELTGYKREEIIGKSIKDQMVKPLSGYDDFISTLFDGKTWNGEIERFKKNGDVLYEKATVSPFFDENGKIINFIKISEDITIYKKADQALKYSEQFKTGLIKTAPDLIFVFDENANFVDFVSNNEELLLVKPEDFIGKNVSDVLPNEIKELTIEKINSVKKSNEVEIYEYDIDIPNIGKSYFEARMIKVNNNFLSAVRNITEQKNKEKELENAQKKYFTLFSNASDAILLIENQKFIECNDKALEIFKCDNDYIINKYPSELSPKYQEDGQLSSEKAKILINSSLSREPQYFSWQHIRKNGEVFTSQISLNSFKLDDKQYIQVIIRDVSKQKLQQDQLKLSQLQLKENERRLRTLMNNLPGMAYRCSNDKDWTMEFVSWGAIELVGYSSEEIVNGDIKWANLIFKEDKEYVWNEVQKAIGERVPYKLYFRLVSKQNEIKWVWEQGEGVFDEYGKLIALEGFVTDITKEKEVEIELIENQQRYYKLFNEAFDAILIMQGEVFIDCNEKVIEMFDCRKFEIIGANFKRFLPEQQRNGENSFEMLTNLINDTLSGKPQFATFELIRNFNTRFWVELSISSFIVENISYVQFIIRDIEERINADHKIKTSEKNYRNLIESSPMGIMITNLKKIFFVNNSAVNILGFSNEDELRKYNLFNYILPEYKDKIFEYFKMTNKGIDTPFFDVILNHPVDNHQIEIEAKAVVFEFNNRKAYQIVLRDLSIQKRLIKARLKAQMIEESNQKLIDEMSERMNAEEKLKKSLSEKDILIKEVHHRVKNNMQIISSILNLQASYIKDDITKQMFQESQDRIKSMALIHENLYRNEDLSKIKFSDYMINLVNNLFRSYNIDYNNIKLNLEVEDIYFNLDVGIPCGLIVNELISNSFKYAFNNCKSGNIYIKLYTENELANLIIADDGKGIDKNIDIYNTNSLGLQLVTTLIDQIEGKIKLTTNNGTQYKITFKK